MSYDIFAEYYDILTQNVNYKSRAEYFDAIIKKFLKSDGKILVDLACGTGSLSEEFCEMGYDVTGVVLSSDMLSVAANKKFEKNLDIFYVNQDMQKLELAKKADVTVCALDSLNHLESLKALKKTIENVSMYLLPGGVFVFDVNSVYKHAKILGNNTFVYDTDEVYCVWQNEYNEKNENEVKISLDFFEYDDENDCYYRNNEEFSEKAWEASTIKELLENSDFEVPAVYAGDTFEPYDNKTERLVFAARKKAE